MKTDPPRAALLQQEIAALRVENKALAHHIEALTQQVEELKQHNAVLRLKVDAMARKLFGKSSEKLDAAQLQMVFDALQKEPQNAAKKAEASDSAACDSEAEAAPAPDSNARRKKRSLDEIIEGLPVTEVVIDPQEVKAQPEAWQCIGAEESSPGGRGEIDCTKCSPQGRDERERASQTKLIDYTPGHFSCIKLLRRKYVRNDARHLPPITAPLLTLQPRCIASPRLLAHTLINRFELHLPFYRIERMYERLGVPLSRQTLCGWAGMAHDACGLVMEAIKREVFADGYVQGDALSAAR